MARKRQVIGESGGKTNNDTNLTHREKVGTTKARNPRRDKDPLSLSGAEVKDKTEGMLRLPLAAAIVIPARLFSLLMQSTGKMPVPHAAWLNDGYAPISMCAASRRRLSRYLRSQLRGPRSCRKKMPSSLRRIFGRC